MPEPGRKRATYCPFSKESEKSCRLETRQTFLFSTHWDLQENSLDTVKEKANYVSYLKNLAGVWDTKASMTSLSWAQGGKNKRQHISSNFAIFF